MEIRKLSASAGAEWLLGGFGLLRRSPFGLGGLGALYGVLAVLMSLAMERSATLFLVLELVLILVGPLIVAGMVYAASRVDAGASAEPGHLLQGVREGKVASLLATLLPQLALTIVAVLLLVVLVGAQQLMQLGEMIEHVQAKPDPQLLNAIPFGRLMLWALLVCIGGLIIGFFTFIATPEIMLGGSRAWDAMQMSFRACVRNLSAVIVFLVLTAIAAMAVYIPVMIVGGIAALIAGKFAMQVVVQLLSSAVLMPVVIGAMYFAWKQMAGRSASTPVQPPIDQLQA